MVVMANSLRAGVLAASVAILPWAGNAFASCSQGDVQGVWHIYTMNAVGAVTRCSISMNSNGGITGSQCGYWSGGSQTSATTASGKITLNNGEKCTFGGSMNIGGLTHNIRELTMSQQKTTGDGFGTYSGGQFLISATKR
jgi:hypothetical protein